MIAHLRNSTVLANVVNQPLEPDHMRIVLDMLIGNPGIMCGYPRNASDPNNPPIELRTSRTTEESVQLICARLLIGPVLDIRVELTLIGKPPSGERVLPAIPLSVTCVQFTFFSSAPGTTGDEHCSHAFTKYCTAEMGVRIQLVIPAKAGIQAVFLDSGCHRNDASEWWSLYCTDLY